MTTDQARIDKTYFTYKLIPPRPDFAGTQTVDERAIMTNHIAYWTEQFKRGIAIAFGAVADPSGDYGLGVIEATPAQAQALADNDPAIRSGLCRYEIHPMPFAIVRPLPGDPQPAAEAKAGAAAIVPAEPRTEISDEQFQALRATARAYTVVIFHPGERRHSHDAAAIIYQHGMRNACLHLDSTLPVVCPTTDSSDFSGLGVFDADPDDVAAIMDADPAIQAGVLTYEVHPVRSFPGSTLPG
jgi:uncharacterized protein YciI